ncbi:MAG: hypothetical protein M3R10_04440, partial [Verrucomicrobiota bacterium]|nr:hypothetical protein [Verrucomicrobiota bacterium]
MKFQLPTVLIFLLAALASAQAASIVVNSTADPTGFDPNITVATLGSTVTLRDAVNAANNTGGTNTVAFNASLAGGIIALGIDGDDTFGPSALLVSSALTIDGGAGGITITRDTTAQPTRLRLFYVNGAGNLTLKNLTVSGGKALGGSGNNGGGAAGLGGAIVNAGLLQLVQTTVTGNQAIGGSQNNNAGAKSP